MPKHIRIQDYGADVGNSWGIGYKEKDNELIITISNFDKSVGVSTSTGTEKSISDYECKVIIDSIMIPHFRMSNYYKGVDKAIDSIILLLD